MNIVEPIIDLEKIGKMKAILKCRNMRNYFLFKLGINVGLRISDMLKLKVNDVMGKTHIEIRETKDIAILMNIFNRASMSVTKRYIGLSHDEMDKSLKDFDI